LRRARLDGRHGERELCVDAGLIAGANARAASAPKPLDAPVMTMIERPPAPQGSRIAAIGPQHLRVHPAARGASQERDYVGNVLRLPEALQRSKPAELLDLCFGFSLQE